MLYRSPAVFSLGPWSAQLQTGFLVFRRTWDLAPEALCFQLQGFHLLWHAFPAHFAWPGAFLLRRVPARTLELPSTPITQRTLP